MGTNCAPLVADLDLFCYERGFMLSLSGDRDAEVIEAFNSTSRYVDDLNTYFDGVVTINLIYPSELHLPSGLFHPYKLNASISNFRGVWCTFSFLFHFE